MGGGPEGPLQRLCCMALLEGAEARSELQFLGQECSFGGLFAKPGQSRDVPCLGCAEPSEVTLSRGVNE